MIARQPTPAGDPGKAPLDHPSSGERTEARRKELLPIHFLSLGDEQPALRNRQGAHRLHRPADLLFEPGDERASIMTISPHQLHAGQLVFHRHEQAFASLLIGPTGGEHFHRQQMALGINQQVSLASPDFFSPRRSLFPALARHWF